nr:PREDICTED: uncharacterized protein LOC107399250 [Tribolium castaneum]|eukprot:XP_015840734.1 PREDICTED: uncharacterized protein LOC107399250 [Tribolium castaneum]
MFLCVKLLLVLIDGSAGLDYNICKNGPKYVKPNCESIFVWDKEQTNFISLFNVTLLNNYTHNSEPIRGKTVRVIADNQNLGGFLGDIWQLIESTLGFTSNVSSVYYDTGLEIITSGHADVMLAPVVAKRGLLNVMYSQPYFYNWYEKLKRFIFFKRIELEISET